MKIGSIVLNTFLILLLVYISIVVFLFFYQRKLLYHPSENNYLDETQLNHKIEKTFIQSNDKLVSWYFKKNSKFKTILFFHGNAGKLDNRVYKLNELSKLNIKLLGVTYLTSWTPEEQADITKEITYNMWKTHIARVMKNNFYGMVCAVDDIKWVKSPIHTMKTICPGIKYFENDNNTGQVRTSSPTQAKKEGADYIVIGRSVTNSDRPLTVLELIRQEITNGPD